MCGSFLAGWLADWLAGRLPWLAGLAELGSKIGPSKKGSFLITILITSLIGTPISGPSPLLRIFYFFEVFVRPLLLFHRKGVPNF